MAHLIYPISSSPIISSSSIDDDTTETIELTDLLTKDLTRTGSFDVRGKIWQTTFGKVLQALPIPVLLIGQSYRVVKANQAWGKISDRYAEIESRLFTKLFPERSLAKTMQGILEDVFSTRKPSIVQAVLEIDKREIWARLTFRSIRIAEKRFVLVLLEDLTHEKRLLDKTKRYQEELERRVEERTAEVIAANKRLQKEMQDRKRVEELVLHSERLKAVGELASGAAHNFNNLLQIVISGARLGLISHKSGDAEKVERALRQILESAELGSETVKRLQSFASVRGDRASGEDSVFDLREVVRPAVELTKTCWKTQPEKRGIDVTLRLDMREVCPILGRKHEIFEVVVNLIKNAAEALPRGGIIEVTCHSTQNEVVIEVRDTGVGIAPEALDKLFIPFFTTKLTAGAGLCLATSQAIASSHKGHIFAESSEGKGTTFTVRLPKSSRPPKAPESISRPRSDRPLRILAIDDVEAVLGLFADGLTAFNHTVYTACSGQEGIEIFERTPVDAVICDLGMPGMTGWEVGRRLKQICSDQGLQKPPLVLRTGWGDQLRETEKMNSSGVDRIIAKPVDIPVLLEALALIVNGTSKAEPIARQHECRAAIN
jgi:signal transduction histidine kinase/CheY-like chemotaxis protein